MVAPATTNFFATIAIILPAFLIALSCHEFAHALAATWLGDLTPRRMGRLTLNPLAHIDPMGLIFLLLIRIGWAKPVQFDPRNFKHRKLYSILTALAGPVMNLVIAVAAFFMMKHFPETLFPQTVSLTLLQMLEAIAHINIMLGVFNLLPIPPLDGSHIIVAFLAEKFPEAVMWLYRYAMFILIFLFIFGPTRSFLISLIVGTANFIKQLIFQF